MKSNKRALSRNPATVGATCSTFPSFSVVLDSAYNLFNKNSMDAPNKSEELGKEPPSHSHPFDPSNCEFMKYLQPSLEAVNDQ